MLNENNGPGIEVDELSSERLSINSEQPKSIAPSNIHSTEAFPGLYV